MLFTVMLTNQSQNVDPKFALFSETPMTHPIMKMTSMYNTECFF